MVQDPNENITINLSEITISNQSVLLINQSQFLNADGIMLNNDSNFILNSPLQIIVQNDVNIITQSHLSLFSNNKAILMDIYSQLSISENSSIVVKYTAFQQNRSLIINVPYLELINNSTLDSIYLYIIATNLTLQDSILSNDITTCRTSTSEPISNFLLPNFTAPLNFSEYIDGDGQEDQDMTAFLTNTTFTIFLFIKNSINMTNAIIKSSFIGIFASYLSIDSSSKITSTGQGCQSDLGPGIPHEISSGSECAMGGGSYGGYGGNGLAYQGDQEDSLACVQAEIYQSSTYGNANNPMFQVIVN